MAPITITHSNSIIHELIASENHLSDDLESLLEDDKYSDVTLLVRSKEFRAHKNILSIRSPVFAAMFEQNMKEKNRNTVEIEDLDPDVLKEILRFLYAGKVENLLKMAGCLLIASERFKLEGLKHMCEDSLCTNLSVDNAMDTLMLADVNKAEKLKAHVIAFIVAHAKDVVETPGYKIIAESQELHLLAEVFRVLALHHH